MNKAFQKKLAVILLMCSGFLAGTSLPHLIEMRTGSYAGFLSLYALQKYRQTEMAFKPVFYYVMRVRIYTLAIVWMSGFTNAGMIAHLFYGWWVMLCAGIMMAQLLFRQGYQGIVIFCCMLLPQWLLYGMMWKCEWTIFRRRQNKKRPETVWRIDHHEVLGVAGLGCLCLTGCVLETWAGSKMLPVFLNIFHT